MLSKTLALTHLPPPATVLDVLNQSVWIPCAAMKTIATSQVTAKTTPPTHNLEHRQQLRRSLSAIPF